MRIVWNSPVTMKVTFEREKKIDLKLIGFIFMGFAVVIISILVVFFFFVLKCCGISLYNIKRMFLSDFPLVVAVSGKTKVCVEKKKRLKEQNSIFLNIKYYMCAFTMRLNKQKIVGNFAITSVGGEKKKSGQFHWKYNKQVLNQTRSITKQALNVKYANMKKIKCIFLIAMLCSATRLVNAFQLRYCWWWTKTTPETTNGFICYDVTYHRCWDAHS